jgi:hypothetical protein
MAEQVALLAVAPAALADPGHLVMRDVLLLVGNENIC